LVVPNIHVQCRFFKGSTDLSKVIQIFQRQVLTNTDTGIKIQTQCRQAPAAGKLNGSQTPERRRQKQTANSVSLKTNGSPLKTKGQRQWVS
jgi:hypothetical protein